MEIILEAAHKSNVKRIVVTSSVGTVIGAAFKKDKGENVYSERDFAPPKNCESYVRSKMAQESVIKAFIEQNHSGVEIVTLHPSFIVGPTIVKERVSSATKLSPSMQ